VPPSKRAGISIPPRLEEIILQCLDKNPNRRPQTARELGDMICELGLDKEWNRSRREQWWLDNEREPSLRERTDDASSPHVRIAPQPGA
jgi:hypothetical protein